MTAGSPQREPAGLDPVRLDAADPLAGFRDRFEIPDPSLSYLDGNSLGRPTRAARGALTDALDRWGRDLVGAWDTWIDRALEVGDLLAPVLGAAPGTVLVGESTTVSLYECVHAALAARPDRSVIVVVEDDFPTDRYVVDAIAEVTGARVRRVPALGTEALLQAIDADVAVVVSSVVGFVSAALVDHATVTRAAHEVGALVVWDCSHAAGAVPLDLDATGVDLAVGCTYKYLHGGPGAPGFTYVGDDSLRPPIHGWFAQRDQFAMGPRHDPLPGAAGWRNGTPGILGLEVAATGIEVVAEAGIAAIRTKSVLLGRLAAARVEELLVPHGATLASPADPARRGGHLSVRHPDASRIVRAARAAGVVADFRAPDVVRLGPGPLACSFDELDRGVTGIAAVLDTGAHLALDRDPGRVT